MSISSSFFDVSAADIAALGDEDLRSLVGKLCELEAIKTVGSSSGVTYGGDQNAPDGGIDVRVCTSSMPVDSFLSRKDVGIQVKAEDFPPAKIKKEMRPDGALRDAIQDLIGKSGAYIIVSSQGSVSDSALTRRRNAMRDALSDEPNADQLYIDFFDRQRLVTWVNQYPGIIAWVRQKGSVPLAGWKPYQDWSSSPFDLDADYILDDTVRLMETGLDDGNSQDILSGINKLRTLLHEASSSVRLVGLSGVGKTRFVQALCDERIGENALDEQHLVYADLSDSPSPAPTDLLAHIVAMQQRCILVIDNCGVDLHKKLTNQLGGENCQVSLITVEYDVSDDEPENTDTFRLEPASKAVIEKVISRKYPTLGQNDISTIADFSDGNSRVALAVAETARNSGSVANLNDSDLIKRLFWQNNEFDPSLWQTAKALSLVYSFDGEVLEGDDSELALLASITGEPPAKVYAQISELMRRGLVQTRTKWRALLPHALAHKLARQALQDFPASIIKSALINKAPERLLKSFSRRLGCLHDSPEASRLVNDWLTDEAFIERVAEGRELSLIVLQNIAPVNPIGALKCLKEAISSNQDFGLISSQLPAVTYLLRAIAYDPALFDDAVLVLAELANERVETNDVARPASVFQSLFFLYLSGTMALPEQRSKFLYRLATSDLPDRIKLVIDGLDAMLECNHFTSFHGFEFGARKRDFGYRPATNGDVWNWFYVAYDLCRKLIHLEGFETPVKEILVSRINFLLRNASPPEKLIELIKDIHSHASWPEAWISIKRTIRFAKKERQDDLVKKLEPLVELLKPKTLPEIISVYVVKNHFGSYEIADVDYDDEDRYRKAEQHMTDMARYIGDELAKDMQSLKTHLPAILNSETNRGWDVAKQLAIVSDDTDAHWVEIKNVIETTGPKGNVGAFLAGFISGLKERDINLAEAKLDEALSDVFYHPYLIQLQFVFDLDKAGVPRVIAAANMPTVPLVTFGYLRNGRICDDTEANELHKMLSAIIKREGGLDLAIEIFDMRLFAKRKDKDKVTDGERKIARGLLSQITLQDKKRKKRKDIERIIKMCLQSPDDDQLAKSILTELRTGFQKYYLNSWEHGGIITALTEKFPRITLDVLVEQGDVEVESRREFFRGLRDRDPCPLNSISFDVIAEWVAENEVPRYDKLSAIFRPWQYKNKEARRSPLEDDNSPVEWNPVALRILENAPNKETALKNYVNSFYPNSWSGSRAQIVKNRSALLQEVFDKDLFGLGDEARKLKTEVDKDIASMRAQEESRSRREDERFEW